MLKPGDKAPPLEFPLISGEEWRLESATPAALTLVSFYRGAFCRFCRGHLAELEKVAPDLITLGITPVAVSIDGLNKARSMADDLELRILSIGYGITIDHIRDWGLFASSRIIDGKAELFAEPALILIRPDTSIYAVFQNSMSCGRPDMKSLIEGLALLAEHGFPLRGNA